MWLPDIMINHIVSSHILSPIKLFPTKRTVMWRPALMMNHIVVHKAATETLVVIINDGIKPIDNHVIIDDMFAEAEGLGINLSLLQTVVTRLVSFCKHIIKYNMVINRFNTIIRVNMLTSTL